MAITANGMIATSDDDTPWSKKEFESFHSMVRKHKNITVGRKTYELMKEANDFKNCGNPFTVVLSRHNNKSNDAIFVSTPKAALKIMASKGFREVLIEGGAKANTAFLSENLVDEIILDIEPMIFGKGINLLAESNVSKRLKLLGIRKFSANELQVHYKVLK